MKQACTIGEKRSFEGQMRLVEERSSSHALMVTPSLDSTRNQEGAHSFKAINQQKVRGPTDSKSLPMDPAGTNCKQEAVKTDEEIQKDRKDVNACENTTCNAGTHQGKEATHQGGQDVASDTADTSLTFDLAANSGGVNHKDTSVQRSPAEANFSSDEAGDETAGPSDSADRTTSEHNSGDKAQTKAQPRRKPYENMQPTRSSLRSCKKVFDMMESEEPEEIKEVAKKHFCLYCKMAFTQLAKHLERKHAEETEVAHAIHFPKGSKVRQTMLDQIRNKGDYEHNCKVFRKGEGEMVAKKQVKNASVSVRDYLPCQHCFAFYRKTDLWRHERSCKARKGDETSAETTKAGRVHPASSRLLPMSEFLTESCKEIIHSMHQDDISRLIRNDPLICKYGNALSVKYGHDKSQFAYIAQKMRELGRFLLAITELDSNVKYLHEVCHPSKFELVVDGAKKASGFDPSSSTFKTVSLVSKIGYSLKRAAEIAFGESRMTEDRETESEVQSFIKLLDTKWSERFSRKSLASSLKQDVKKLEVDKSTVTEDLVKLHTFITGEEAEARRDLLESPSLSTWKKLSEATLADVCLFNRGRVGNIGRMLLNTYVSKKSRGVFMPSADQVRKSSKLELVLGGSFTRLELEGQYGRNMLVMLTERMVLSIDLLIENRENAGVSKSNPYLFARTEGPSFIRGLDCFRRAAMECGVKNPEALLSSSLREQISCCWQLMSLSEQELDQVAKLVGRSSQDCYALPKNAPQLEEVSKELLQMDRTLLAGPPGATTDGTALKAALKRRPWSEKEQTAVRTYLSDFITKMKVPGKKECNACIAAEPDLCGRSWTDIKNYVHNTLQTARRRSNQPKPEGLSTPKSSTAEVQASHKADLDDIPIARSLTSQLSDHIRESSNCCMSVAPLTNIREPTQYPQEMALSYTNLCSTGASMIHTTQPLMSSFTALNATDTQVVPTFTPHNTTNALMSSPYTSENRILPMVPSYTQSATSMAPHSVYNPQDPVNSMLPSYSPLSLPSTSMVPTFTSLTSPSAPMVPTFSPLSDRSRVVVSSFTPLNNPSTPAYPASPPRTSTTAQVVPTIIGHSVPDRAPLAQENSPMSTPGGKLTPPAVKAQKRNKRLWSGEEQAAVRRQFGDFCKLAKVPGKKDCDACLAAEPVLSTRTWREVKYFVHNSIQSLKRRGQATVLKETGPQEPETLAPNSEWDGPVYLSL